MIIELQDTSSRDVAAELLRVRRLVGAATGLVLTLLIITPADRFDEVLEAAKASATAHPSRVIVVSYVDGEEARLDATLEIGEGHPGDLIVLQLHGPLREHGDAICLPLLLPDSPTIAWWPNTAPDNLSDDPVGSLADRRITDALGCDDPQRALLRRAKHHEPGDTDLAWTRLTRWRALLAAALDQSQVEVTSAHVVAAPDNAPAALLAAWLSNRLGVDTTTESGPDQGVNAVRLGTPEGDIVIRRVAAGLAQYSVPGQPQRTVALKRRMLTDLLTEELQRMDADDIFEAACRRLVAEETNN